MRSLLAAAVLLSGGLLSACPLVARGQTYHLTSCEGKPVTIRLSYKLFSKRLAVACAGDTLFLRDYQGTELVKLLQHRFLQITYQTRCGTGCSLQNTALVAVSQQKLLLPLLVMSDSDSEDFTPRNERAYHYRLSLAMPGGTSSPYTITARVREEERFQSQPSQNRRQYEHVTLRWDAARRVFYSGFELTSRCLPVYDEATKRSSSFYDLTTFYLIQPELFSSYVAVLPRWFVGMLPVVRLRSDLYYFINGNWFTGPAKPIPNQPYWFTKNEVKYVPKREHSPWF